MMATLEYNDNGARKLAKIEKRSLFVGRGNGVDIQFPEDEDMSRHHFSLVADVNENSFYLRDDGSLNGTFLNGSRVDVILPRQLKDGDEITAGQQSFFFHI